MMRRFASLAVALATLASPLAAQATHPDFSGKWALDPKSIDSPMAPTSATMTVVQDAKTLKIDQSMSSQMGDQTASLTYNLDGSPSKNTVNAQGMAIELNSTANWEGNVLVIKTTADVQGQPLVQSGRWSLDPDGKTMREQLDMSVAGQSMSMKMAFIKQ
jgi:opacity protein-like surface antigen